MTGIVKISLFRTYCYQTDLAPCKGKGTVNELCLDELGSFLQPVAKSTCHTDKR